MNAKIDTYSEDAPGEPVADIYVRTSDLIFTEISGDIIPLLIDEIPIINSCLFCRR